MLGQNIGRVGLPDMSAGGRPSLTLDFVSIPVLNEKITFTRTGSTATYFNSAGVLTTTVADQPRFDYNPSTLAARGLLIEEARTNSIRNNTMQGAVAGTPGTTPTNWSLTSTGATTYQVVGTGTENGLTYIDLRIQGTGAADTWNLIYDSSIVAANGQTWTGAIYLKLAGGSITNLPFIQRLVFRDSGFANIQSLDSSALTPTTAGLATQRNTISLTATQATTAFVTLQLNSGTPTGAYDITLRIGLPQLELGAFATSVIPTTTTALTRSADVASVNTLSPWFNATAGTIFCQGLTPPGLANFPSIGPALSDGTTTNRMIQYGFTNGFYGAAVTSGASQGNTFVLATPTIGAQYKFATAYSNNDSQSALNGTASTVDNTYTAPTVNQMQINTSGTASSNLPNSWIQRITYYPRRLSQAELTAITT